MYVVREGAEGGWEVHGSCLWGLGGGFSHMCGLGGGMGGAAANEKPWTSYGADR